MTNAAAQQQRHANIDQLISTIRQEFPTAGIRVQAAHITAKDQ